MDEERVWDIKKIIIGIVSVSTLLGVGYAAKVYVLDKQKVEQNEVVQNKETGEVAGEQADLDEEETIDVITREDIQRKVDDIKEDVSNLKPEDVVKQEPVQKILKDLENLKTSTQGQLTDSAKDTVCEQAKKIFCSQ